uniref:Uncharacterized protein n=1 Tax=Oryza sativa subsp. japonica TaxID=39947 RepID=Q69KA6_ORYSJ|nr:hypothetical protein [Oryza sativa Japonica Group]
MACSVTLESPTRTAAQGRTLAAAAATHPPPLFASPPPEFAAGQPSFFVLRVSLSFPSLRRFASAPEVFKKIN